MYAAKILADSINLVGNRLTTLEVTFPRFILAEFNTHRMLSRNSASSRAIPVERRIKELRDKGPFLPEAFTRNKPGMQGGEELAGPEGEDAAAVWVAAAAHAVVYAEQLAKIGVHKQYANRLLELFMWHTCVVSATEWDNFFHLRDHPDAQPEFQRIACLMREVMAASTPQLKNVGQWHLPYIIDEDIAEAGRVESRLDAYELALVSAARCARVSYTPFDSDKRDTNADLQLAEKLLSSGHMSPFEHPAKAGDWPTWYGNFLGWRQYRKRIAAEDDRLGPRGLNTAREYPDA